MYHAGAQQFNPAFAFAGRTALATAVEALHVNLAAGFREREVMRTEADDRVLPVHGLDERFKCALQISHCDALVDDKAFNLVEHGGVRRVNFVLAVHAARSQNTDRRLADGFHGANLHGAGLCAQEDFFVICHIERVAAVTGGMILRNVQFGEVIVGKFNLGAVKNFEAHGDKNILGLIERFVHRVAVAQLNRSSGDGHVDCLGLQSGFHGLFLEFGTDGLDFFLNGSADIVRSLSHNGTFLCRQLAHCLQNTGQFTFFAEKAHAQRVQFSGVLDALERAERFLPDLFELFLHKRILLFVIIQKNKPFARDRDERPCFRGTTRCSQKKSALLFMPDNGGNNRRVLVGK